MKLWLFDHGTHWAECVGDWFARPWIKLSRWSYKRYIIERTKCTGVPDFKSLKELGVPWYYRWRFTNWLMAEPWLVYPLSKKGWHYRTMYKAERREHRIGQYHRPAHSRFKSAWLALTFPHVHHEKEDDE